jgi:hypothetical protein
LVSVEWNPEKPLVLLLEDDPDCKKVRIVDTITKAGTRPNIDSVQDISCGTKLMSSSLIWLACWGPRSDNFTCVTKEGNISIFSKRGDAWSITDSTTGPLEFQVGGFDEDEPAEVFFAK